MTHSAFCVTLYTARFVQLILDTNGAPQTPAVKPDPSLCRPDFYGADKNVQRIIQGPSKMCGKCTTCSVFPDWDILDCVGQDGRAVWAVVEELCGPGWKGCVGRGGRAVWARMEGLCGPWWKGCVGWGGRAVWALVEGLCGPGWKGCVGRGGRAVRIAVQSDTPLQ